MTSYSNKADRDSHSMHAFELKCGVQPRTAQLFRLSRKMHASFWCNMVLYFCPAILEISKQVLVYTEMLHCPTLSPNSIRETTFKLPNYVWMIKLQTLLRFNLIVTRLRSECGSKSSVRSPLMISVCEDWQRSSGQGFWRLDLRFADSNPSNAGHTVGYGPFLWIMHAVSTLK